MDLEKFTERSRGFLQAAQTIATRDYHQRLTPEHLLKALLDDEEGAAAGLIRAAGGDPQRAKTAVDAELGRLPKVQGSGAGHPQATPDQITNALTAAYCPIAMKAEGAQKSVTLGNFAVLVYGQANKKPGAEN